MVRKYAIAQLVSPLPVDQPQAPPPVDPTAEGDIFASDPAVNPSFTVVAGNITGGFQVVARNNDAACADVAGVVATRLEVVYFRIEASVLYDVEVGYINAGANVCNPGLRTLDRSKSRNSILTGFQSNGAVPNQMAKFFGIPANTPFEWPMTAPPFARDAPGLFNGIEVGARAAGPFNVSYTVLYRQVPTP